MFPKRLLRKRSVTTRKTSKAVELSATSTSDNPLFEVERPYKAGISTKVSLKHKQTEDRIIAGYNIGECGVSLFGVVDGHAGYDCSAFVSEALPRAIQKCATDQSLDTCDSLLHESWGQVLEEAFHQVAYQWDTEINKRSGGAVATLVLISNRSCLIAHAGDCKVVASLNNSSFVELTREHRANDPDEQLRVEDSGGVVFNGRVSGRLLPTRVFGDIDVRTNVAGDVLNCIDPEPEICYHTIDETQDGFIIIATDGLFDVLSSKRAYLIVRESLRLEKDPTTAARRLVNAAERSKDDVSVLVLSWSAKRTNLFFSSKKMELLNACQNPSENERVKSRIIQDPAILSFHDDNGWNILTNSCKSGNVDLVNFLLRTGVNPNPTTPHKHTALRGAAINGHLEVVQLLLEAGALVDILSEGARTPLMGACMNNHGDIVKILLDHGANPRAMNTYGETAIDLARNRKYDHIVSLLLKYTKQ